MAQRKDPHLDLVLSAVLLVGSLVGMAVILWGLSLYFIHHPDTASVTDAVALPFRELASQVLQGRSLAILDLGLVALMLTPILRVAMAIYQFWREGDRRYTLVSIGVLAVLAVSLFLARG